MKQLVSFAFAAALLQCPISAQTPGVDNADTAGVETSAPADSPASPSAPSASATEPAASREYVPMTSSERARKYILGAFGPGAILRAAASGGIDQWKNSPKEWGGGPEAYGDRFGSALAKHVIREALEYGGSLALHEDNRYFRSTDTGFFKRSKHAVASIFVARNEAGGEHFAYSRFGSVAGSSFISRLWQPNSTNTAGDAAVSFGLTMVTDMGWNLFKEFAPKSLGHRLKVR
jgi:hypothetical protein